MKRRISLSISLLMLGGVCALVLMHHGQVPPPTADVSSVLQDSPPVAPVLPMIVPEKTGSLEPFRLITLGEDPGAELTAAVGVVHVGTVLALNRLDEKHMSKGMTVVVPASFDDAEAFESFPLAIADLKDVPKIMLVSQRVQAFALYEHGQRIRSGPVSTGKKSTPSPSRLYFTNWKGKLVTSSIDDEWIMPWYFNLDNKEGVSMHQYDLPGYPASHACVRMYEWDAKFIYDWADQWQLSDDGQTVLATGTPVLLFGEYAYGKLAPWKSLPDDAAAIMVTPDELTNALDPYLSEIVPSETN